MPYVQVDLLIGDEYDEHIVVLEHLLGDSAIIRNGHLAANHPVVGRIQEKVQRNLFGRLPQPSSPLERPPQPSSMCLWPNDHLRVV